MSRDRSSGVSQLELMISLSIMALIAVLMANALNFNRQSLERTRFQTKSTEMLLVRKGVQDWIEDMPLELAGENTADFFEGNARSLRFKSQVVDGSLWGGELAEFKLEVIASGGLQSLIVVASGRHPSKMTSLTLQRILAEDVSAFKIAYFGQISSETTRRWHNSWSDQVLLPDLVKMEWETSSGSPVPPITLQPGKTERRRYQSLDTAIPER